MRVEELLDRLKSTPSLEVWVSVEGREFQVTRLQGVSTSRVVLQARAETRVVQGLQLHEISLVPFPPNPRCVITSVTEVEEPCDPPSSPSS